MQPSQAPECGASKYESSFDPQRAKAMQEAEQYNNVSGAMMLIAGLAAILAFVAELGSWSNFGDWLQSQNWASHGALEGFGNWLVEAFPFFFFIFGLWGIAALFMKDRLAKVSRIIFLSLAVPMLLLPVLRGETKRLLLIGVAVCIYIFSRWLAKWANNQRPRDWKIALAEKKRLGWGQEEFARALTKGRASDGHRLAVLKVWHLADADFTEMDKTDLSQLKAASSKLQKQVEALVELGAFGELRTVLPPEYVPYTSLLRLTLKQRYPHAIIDPRKLLENDGVSLAEREAMAETKLYVHPEIVERLESLIDR